MKKYLWIYSLLWLFVLCTSCKGQDKTELAPPEGTAKTSKSAPQVIGTSPLSFSQLLTTHNEKNINTKYEYTESNGARVIIQNSFPKGGLRYKAPNGKEYVYGVFWTRIINETFDPLELTIDFPLDSFEIPSSSGNYMRLFLPFDTLTRDKEPLFSYGLAVKSYLDYGFYKTSSLKRTIHPKGSSAFYVITLSTSGVDGPIRAGLSLKEQNLFYTVNDTEIQCGKINLKNLRLWK